MIYKYFFIDGFGGIFFCFLFWGGRFGDGFLVFLVFNVVFLLFFLLLLDYIFGIFSLEGGFNGVILFLVELLFVLCSIELDWLVLEIDFLVVGEELKYEVVFRFFFGKGDKEVNMECGWFEGLDEGCRREERRKVKLSFIFCSNW